MFDRIIESYGRTLRWVLERQKATMVVFVGTLVLTVFLFMIVPKGFFPVEDTGVIQGITEASQSVSFPSMARASAGAPSAVILRDPAVESLSSFIGIDGTNTTLNSGRILINLKPLAKEGKRSDVISRLQPEVAKVGGVTLFMQPVQDLTVDARVSRTQFQYTMEDPDADELYTWAPKLVNALKLQPELRDVSSDQQDQGLRLNVP